MRPLDETVLNARAKHYAMEFLSPDRPSPSGKMFHGGPSYVIQDLYNLNYLDEYEFVKHAFKQYSGPHAMDSFNKLADKRFELRSEKVLAELLKRDLAIDLDGEHIPGAIGRVKIGARVVGFGLTIGGRPKQLYWPLYMGEGEERAIDSGVADKLPDGAQPLPIGALNTRISNEIALIMCNGAVDQLDSGSGAAIIDGRSGSQPTDPDTSISGTQLFVLVCSDPAFGAASDLGPGGRATASSITDDSSANATGTLGYCRASSSNNGSTSEDDQIDGEAGTSGADFNFNTLAIVSGATVSMTAWTVTQPET